MHRLFTARVVDNQPLNSRTYLISLEPLDSTIDPVPGQFYMLQAGDSLDPLLKRPFSYFRKTVETIQFLYAVRGKGTAWLSSLRPGARLQAIGPLGNGYPEPSHAGKPLLIGGGVGIASLFPLAERLASGIHIIYGARCKSELLMVHELQNLCRDIILCTDDCSFGTEGKVTDVLSDFLSHSGSVPYVIYACGPRPMLASIADIIRDSSIKGYASLEENMACGFGACLGCSVKTVNGYKRVCKEGPVFPIEEIVW